MDAVYERMFAGVRRCWDTVITSLCCVEYATYYIKSVMHSSERFNNFIGYLQTNLQQHVKLHSYGTNDIYSQKPFITEQHQDSTRSEYLTVVKKYYSI